MIVPHTSYIDRENSRLVLEYAFKSTATQTFLSADISKISSIEVRIGAKQEEVKTVVTELHYNPKTDISQVMLNTVVDIDYIVILTEDLEAPNAK